MFRTLLLRPRGPRLTRAFTSQMDPNHLTATQLEVRAAITKLCSPYPDSYWADRDRTETYPHELHRDLSRDGWIGISLPPSLGGAGLGIAEAAVMLQTISESGAGMAGAQSVHANIYATQPVSKFATPAQQAEYLTPLINGTARTCFGVTEPNSGLDTLSLTTTATRDGDTYRISGTKIWITNAQIADTMVLLARTAAPPDTPAQKCLSLFYIPLNRADPGLTIKKIPKMGARAVDANEVFFDNYAIPASCRIGAEGEGFKIVLHGMNAERILVGAEALGLGYAALNKAVTYARERVVFGRTIGRNQGIQHPLAKVWMQLEAAKLAVYNAAEVYDAVERGEREVGRTEVGAMAGMGKFLAAEAAWESCERAVLTLGGMGYAQEFHVERYLRECLVPKIAPVSREMVLGFVAEKVLGLEKSY